MNSFFKMVDALSVGLFKFPIVFIHSEEKLTDDYREGNAIHLPSSAKGICIIAVEGSGNFRSTIKTILK